MFIQMGSRLLAVNCLKPYPTWNGFRPEIENVATGDYITIEGTPNVNLRIEPEIAGGIGTTVMCVNMIPHVLNATPGLKTMLDLPAPRVIMSDVRELIKK